ncbi:MAG: hypothetical protein KJ630_19205 [Proteobacteria bacterium]|nr:hypothetical protein [Pseudomonadota bacterium]
MGLFLEFEYIDKNNDGRKTGFGCEGENDRETRKLFNNAKQFAVPIKTCDFLLDLRDEDRTIIDTIGISRDGFEKVTGKKPMSDDEYVDFDIQFWQAARRMMEDNSPDMLVAS